MLKAPRKTAKENNKNISVFWQSGAKQEKRTSELRQWIIFVHVIFWASESYLLFFIVSIIV